jgi:hypothetical protein
MGKTAAPSCRLAFICVGRQHITFLFDIEKRLINTNQINENSFPVDISRHIKLHKICFILTSTEKGSILP